MFILPVKLVLRSLVLVITPNNMHIISRKENNFFSSKLNPSTYWFSIKHYSVCCYFLSSRHLSASQDTYY